MKQSFSTSEVAKYCHVTADTIRKWAEAGRIRVFKTPGGHRRIGKDELLRFLRQSGIPIHTDLKSSEVKVLVVDADPTIASMVQRFLDRCQTPIQMLAAGDGFDAGHAVATFLPDVVFLDLHMSGLDGFEVCGRIHALQEPVDAKVIALSEDSDAATLARASLQGAVCCLRKPFTPDDLRKALALAGVEVN
jgi:two-component system, OmpR family, response regulator RpaA